MENDGSLKSMINHYAVKEVMFLRKLQHMNIATAHQVHWKHDMLAGGLQKYDPLKKDFRMYIEMEKARHDLQELTKQHFKGKPDTCLRLTQPQIKCVLKQICEGLMYLHEDRHIVHRDIKPANILWYDYDTQKKLAQDSADFSGDGLIKITDFNHAIEYEKLIEMGYRGPISAIGTLWFMAPEFLLEQPYSYGIDVWGLGCIFQYLLNGDG